MHAHSVLIRNIQHLTDARYFAAMGVEWISMQLTVEQKSFDRWHALRDWVEGVRLLAEFDFKHEELLAKVIIDARPDGVILDETTTLFIPQEIIVFRELEYIPATKIHPNDFIILSIGEDLSFDFNHPAHKQIFLEADWNAEKLDAVISNGFKGGFCFEGTKEDLIGVKDYSEMDEMMERIGK